MSFKSELKELIERYRVTIDAVDEFHYLNGNCETSVEFCYKDGDSFNYIKLVDECLDDGNRNVYVMGVRNANY